MSSISFPFFPTADQISEAVGSCPGAFFLDSADAQSIDSQYSFIGLFSQEIVRGDNPWPEIRKWKADQSQGAYPLMSGWVGFLGYEAAQFLDYPASLFYTSQTLPTYWFARHDVVLVLDHQKKSAFLTSHVLTETQLQNEISKWKEQLTSPPQADVEGEAPIRLGRLEGATRAPIIDPWNLSDYKSRFHKVKNYLEAGDAYQINLTGRFQSETSLSAAELYQNIRRYSPAPYAAFLNAGDFQICSASPECFLKSDNEFVETRPIKGTRPRSSETKADIENRHELEMSEKEAAELLMIVDLERNDLGKICEFGSVHVKDLGSTQSFAHVHHRVARVIGRLKSGCNGLDALAALFPGGSITGAPKRRAMEIIHELEISPREVYTGALGYWDDSGQTLWNIPIRTLYKKGASVYWHAGSGLVVDSDPQREYEEVFLKTKGIREALKNGS